jgi:asparagine synthase (glutamine-hydrolysing)
MCGIAGWFDNNRDLTREVETARKMSDVLAPRGPDAAGIYSSKKCVLAHRRLAVVDIENGVQPMSASMNGIKYTLIYNGELYNTAEIKSELLSYGHFFKGHGDTEVLLKAYMQWGKDCLKRLNGIYAFAVLTETENESTLFLARDRVGVKPFFFYPYDGGIIFASEIKALLQHRFITPELTNESILDIFLLAPARRPGSGVFKNIYELKPGQCATYSDGKLKIGTYWKLLAKHHTESFEETVEHVRFLIKDSIKRQLVSDVPLCSFLSGGLDSSIISSEAAKTYALNNQTFSTYSIDYKDNRKNFQKSIFQPDEDAPWIKVMCEALHTDHRDFVTDSADLVEALKPATAARDFPGMADVDSSLYLFCGEVKRNFTVAVSGECADEIFGGYPWYVSAADGNTINGFPWAKSTAFRSSLIKPEYIADTDPEEYVNNAAAETFTRLDYLDSDTDVNRNMRNMFGLNFYWFMQTLLDRKDRMSMANSLEVRVPFCDHRIAEYAYNIPWTFKHFRNREKGLIRYAFENELPEGITWRKKSPYPKTHNPTYMHLVTQKLTDIISEPDCAIAQYLNIDNIKKMLTDLPEVKWYGQLMALPQTFAFLIQTEYWLRSFS